MNCILEAEQDEPLAHGLCSRAGRTASRHSFGGTAYNVQSGVPKAASCLCVTLRDHIYT